MAFDIVGAIVVLVGGNPILVVFLVSIIGNMIPFFPVPYLLFVITIASGFPGLGLFQIAAVSALGASMGKFVSYGVGYGARRALSGRAARSSQGCLEDLLGGGLYVSILSAVIVILVAILLMRVDWEDVLVEGRRGMIRRLLKGILRRNDRSKKQSDPAG